MYLFIFKVIAKHSLISPLLGRKKFNLSRFRVIEFQFIEIQLSDYNAF